MSGKLGGEIQHLIMASYFGRGLGQSKGDLEFPKGLFLPVRLLNAIRINSQLNAPWELFHVPGRGHPSSRLIASFAAYIR